MNGGIRGKNRNKRGGKKKKKNKCGNDESRGGQVRRQVDFVLEKLFRSSTQ